MSEYLLSFKPTTRGFGEHDPSAVLFKDGKLVFGIEEERLSRNKHAVNEFPLRAIRECLSYANITLSDIDQVRLPYRPELVTKLLYNNVSEILRNPALLGESQGDDPESESGPYLLAKNLNTYRLAKRGALNEIVRHRLEREFDDECPPIETVEHHRCHAASAFHPADFTEALVLTIDGRGEYDSTVVWRGDKSGLERIKTYAHPNSLGHFYGIVTEYLGYRAFNGEGKIMGLAPYGSNNEEIESKLRDVIEVTSEYDVTDLTTGGIEAGVQRLERLFNRPRNETKGSFDQWQKDLAFITQKLLEEIVVGIVRRYASIGSGNVGLSGGVALNCKMNKRVMELDSVEELFIQPVAHDGGLAVGAGMIGQQPDDVEAMSDVYWGSSFEMDEITRVLEKNKIDYEVPENLEATIAEDIADGQLIGWYQGRMEMGPRALGNRSILADPRTEASRDRVNRYVKHREEWRPFAPSMLEEAAEEYLHNGEPSPFMIKTFEVRSERTDEITAVLHPGDDTTRPQTVNEDQNPRYYRLIEEFEQRTGVPVVLNTSFNDHGEPVVRTPTEAIKDFYGMGLDVLVLNDAVVRKH
ncbi:carbamoyltransferase family protein [Halobellus litoreus]|uniref:Carbamoyltransferase n=1 Tax=Halobellus litoreus TaxID=755310 RepID=A0ABD6DXE7_9EURY|nr:carbamoyltransferase C-terminal domain-containing protein [Halobellus litoreus]